MTRPGENLSRYWRRALSSTRQLVFVTDRDGSVIAVSAALARLVGWEPEDPVRHTCSSLLHHDGAAPEECPLLALLLDGEQHDAEVHSDVLGKDLHVTATPIPDDDGKVAHVLHVADDISARKEIEAALRASEERYRSFFEDSPVAMWEQDDSLVKAHLERLVAAGVDDVIAYLLADREEYARCVEFSRTLDANKAAQRLFEAESREELLARNSDLYRSEKDRGMYRFWAAMLAGERSATYEETNLSLRGREVQVLETCTVVPGHEDTFDRVYVADVDITERKRAEEALLESEARLQRTLDGTIAALGATVEVRDPYTAGHERRVAELAGAIAGRLGWGPGRVAALRTAALVHDIGKIAVPAEILSRPARLTDTEFSLVQSHPQAAVDILVEIAFGTPIMETVLQHHERLDGSGYPGGISGAEILPEARLLAVADVFEAMTTHRPYRPALSVEEAATELREGAGARYDSDAVAACLSLVEDEGFTFSELP